MATEDTKTTDAPGTPQAEREDTPDSEQPREPALQKSAGADADAEKSEAADTAARDDLDTADGSDDDLPEIAADQSRTAFAAGAAAVVSAGLGLCSLVGTPLSDMLRSRKELIGQIEASSGGGGGADQIQAFYNTPWHTAALLNGVFAVVAVLVGGGLLAAFAGRAGVGVPNWTKAVALGGVVLGALGLLVAGGMYFDLFASTPELPKAPPAAPAPQ